MNILYLDLDSLRPDHLGCYGYHRHTSPVIDKLAERGAVFTQAYCSDAPCCPSRTAFNCGRFGTASGLLGHGGTAGDLHLQGEPRGFRNQMLQNSLASVLHRADLHTATISPFPNRHSAFHVLAGMHEWIDTGKMGMESAEEVTPTVLDWFDRKATAGPWFLHVNYWDPHMPTRVPEEYGEPFSDEPLPAWLTEDNVATILGKRGAMMPHRKQEAYRKYREGGGKWQYAWPRPPYPRNPGSIASFADVKHIIDGYDASVRYLDEHVGKLVDHLQALGVLDDTIIVISADHGENLGELGIFGDHITADEYTMHVPLIISGPGIKPGQRHDGFRYHLDVAPTLCELMNLEPAPNWHGQSFAQTLASGTDDQAHEDLVLTTGAGTCQRSLRWDKYLAIRSDHDGYNAFPDWMLFDLSSDPHQQHDLAATHPSLIEHAKTRLQGWEEAVLDGGQDPLQTIIAEGGPSHVRNSAATILQQLEELGATTEVAAVKRSMDKVTQARAEAMT